MQCGLEVPFPGSRLVVAVSTLGPVVVWALSERRLDSRGLPLARQPLHACPAEVRWSSRWRLFALDGLSQNGVAISHIEMTRPGVAGALAKRPPPGSWFRAAVSRCGPADAFRNSPL